MPNSSIIAVISCGVIEPEVRHYAAGLGHIRRLEFLPQGLHEDDTRMRRELQAAVDRAEADPALLEKALGEALAASCGPLAPRVVHCERFRPGRPVPTHRIPAPS